MTQSKLFTTLIILFNFIDCGGKLNEINTATRNNLKGLSGYMQYFERKKQVKQKAEMIRNSQAVLAHKFLKQQLNTDMTRLKNEEITTDPAAGKLLAILENIEAIEMNLKIADALEAKANQLCSIYFEDIDKLKDYDKNPNINNMTFLQNNIPNFKHVNYDDMKNGLFVRRSYY